MRNPFRRRRGNDVSKAIERGEFNLSNFYTALGIDPSLDGEAMSNATYYACVRILSESLGKIDFRLQRRNQNNGGIDVIKTLPIARTVSCRPNRFESAVTFFSEMESDRCQYGDCYAWITGHGQSLSIWHIPYQQITPLIDNTKLFSDQEDLYYQYTASNGDVFILADREVLHVRTFDTKNGVTGVGVAERLADTINSNIKGQRMTNRLWESGTARAVLQYTGDLSDTNAKRFLKQVQQYMSSDVTPDNRIIPLPVGASLTPISLDLRSAAFESVMRSSSIAIASAFGIKPSQIGSDTNTSYSSSSQQALDFLQNTLLYIVKLYEAELTEKLLTSQQKADGFYFHGDLSELLRADYKSTVEALSTGVSNFMIRPNEARAMLDLPADPDGEKLIGNGSCVSLDLVGVQWNANSNTGEGGGD